MEKLSLLILAIGSLILFINWRTAVAQKKLAGRPVPEALIQAMPQAMKLSTHGSLHHQDGMLIYFYHPACRPCRQMSHIVDQLKQEYPDCVEKFNVADNWELAIASGIRSTPTIILVKNNTIAQAIIGTKSAKHLEALLRSGEP